MVNLGGGFPTKYLKDVPAVEPMATRSSRRSRKHFGNRLPETIIEPGRGMVGNAGVIKAEVVLVSKKQAEDEVRWVYLDIGKFGGLAETMDEAIRYPIRTAHDERPEAPACSPARPAIRPTCCTRRRPTSCRVARDRRRVLIEGTGAYTTTYSSVAFNGFRRCDLRDLTSSRARPGTSIHSIRHPGRLATACGRHDAVSGRSKARSMLPVATGRTATSHPNVPNGLLVRCEG